MKTCNNCVEIINDTSSKIVLCKNCYSRLLKINCTKKLNIQLRKSLATYTCHSDALKCVPLADISIEQNEEFPLCVTNSFIITHTNNKITAIKLEKNDTQTNNIS